MKQIFLILSLFVCIFCNATLIPVFTCGFECGVSSVTDIGQHFRFGSVTVVTYSTTTVNNGAQSLRINPAGVSTGWSTSASLTSSAIYVIRAYIRFATLPSIDLPIVSVGAVTAIGGAVFKVSDSKIYAGHIVGGTSVGATGVTVTTGVWYLIDVKFDQSANPWTIDVSVDGTACGQATRALAASTSTNIVFGTDAAIPTADYFIDDVLVSQTLADYPIGAGYVNHFIPTSDGTHTATTTTIVKGTIAAPTGEGNVAGATDVFNWVNAVPLLGGATNNTRLVNQQSNGTTLYAEEIFGAAPGISTPTVAPRGVEVITADREATTSTGDFTTKLNDNGTESTIIARGVVAGVITDRYASKFYAVAPTGGAWTVVSGAGNFNNIRARFGYASDANPDQYWRGIMIEAEFAPAVPAVFNKGGFFHVF